RQRGGGFPVWPGVGDTWSEVGSALDPQDRTAQDIPVGGGRSASSRSSRFSFFHGGDRAPIDTHRTRCRDLVGRPAVSWNHYAGSGSVRVVYHGVGGGDVVVVTGWAGDVRWDGDCDVAGVSSANRGCGCGDGPVAGIHVYTAARAWILAGALGS